MSAKKQLQRFASVTALAFLGLSSLFNNAAAQEQNEPPAPTPIITPAHNPATQTATPPAILVVPASKHDTEILSQIAKIDQIIEAHKKDETYNPQNDRAIHDAIDAMIAALNAGADPDYFPGKDGIKVIGANTMSALQAAIVVGNQMSRADLAIAFIEKSKNLRKKSPDDWSAMDYAVSGFIESQSVSMTRARNSARILETLHNKGLALSEAAAMYKISEGKLNHYTDIANGLVGIQALYVSTLISTMERYELINGNAQLDHTIRNTTSITADMMTKHGGKVIRYPESVPGDPDVYNIRAGDSLSTLAGRFYRVMGMATQQDAVDALAKLNNIPTGLTDLKPGEKLLIPVPLTTRLGTVTPNLNMSLMMLADRVSDIYHDSKMTQEEIAREIALTNNIDPARIHEANLLVKGKPVDVGLINNTHNQLPRLLPPAGYQGNREVDLIVIEPMDPHARNTYMVANGTAYSINPHVDLTQIHSLSEMLMSTRPSKGMSDALQMLLSAKGSPVQDRVVFSHSMAVKIEQEEKADKIRNMRGHDSAAYENIRLYMGQMEGARPIIFNAAGNFWPEEGRYIQAYQIAHSPRSVLIGAVGQYPVNKQGDTDRIISPYSTHGADLCAPLPLDMARQMEGTSFSTPLTAAIYRQMAEWYGDTLSFEEIMAAALMSADRDVLDYANTTSPAAGTSPTTPFATKPADFRSNGGGLPNSERCGAGVLNMQRWQEALDLLVVYKTSPNLNAQGNGPASTVEKNHTLNVSAPQIIMPKSKDMKPEYVYRLTVPSDMTTGKLTFLLPQYEGATSEIVIRTPGGFEKHLGKSLFGVVSTFAFAYEDIKAGSHFEIRTNKPLGPTAGMILRGHTPGNPIALLRDQLRAFGVLPAPNMTMEGNVSVGSNKPLNVLQEKPANPTPPAPASADDLPPFRPEDMPVQPSPQQKRGPAPSL